jgi:hypothetical protein
MGEGDAWAEEAGERPIMARTRAAKPKIPKERKFGISLKRNLFRACDQAKNA